MTPERIEEVRKILSGMNQSSQLLPITVGDLNSLLAALEESQQEYDLMKFDRDALVKLVSNHQSAVDDACRKLAEAQQTIKELQEVNTKWALDALFKEDDN